MIRTLVVEIGGEAYAIPLSRISRVLKLDKNCIQSIQGRQHFTLEGQQVGLATAHQVFGCLPSRSTEALLPVVVLGERERSSYYGLVVDRFLGEEDLVIHPIDPRLGKIKDISAAALLPDRSPVLVIDTDDLIRSIANLSSAGTLALASEAAQPSQTRAAKRISWWMTLSPYANCSASSWPRADMR
jgi:two-component system sensor histidine kinase and response regulator WspE